MNEIFENTVTAALMFKVPQKVGWSVLNNDQSWTGSELSTFMIVLRETNDGNPPRYPCRLSLS